MELSPERSEWGLVPLKILSQKHSGASTFKKRVIVQFVIGETSMVSLISKKVHTMIAFKGILTEKLVQYPFALMRSLSCSTSIVVPK